jgi:hypothetical protein
MSISSLPDMHKEIKQWIERVRRRLNGRIQIHPVLLATVGNRGTTSATVKNQYQNFSSFVFV